MGGLGLPAIVGNRIAADLQIAPPTVFAGSSILYVTMGLCGPLLAGPFRRVGARHVMMIGTVIAALGFVMLACAPEAVLYFIAWMVLGAAGSAALSTAAYIMLNEVAGRNAKGAIGALMLVTGLSSSIFWPTTAFLAEAVGWRGTCLVYAVAMILVCLPLYTFGLPRRATGKAEATSSSAGAAAPPRAGRGTFLLVVAARREVAITAGPRMGRPCAPPILDLLACSDVRHASCFARAAQSHDAWDCHDPTDNRLCRLRRSGPVLRCTSDGQGCSGAAGVLRGKDQPSTLFGSFPGSRRHARRRAGG
ncbi:MFS transporter [Bradyrhizobium sp. I1.14.4]|uniref:MFS transporter n=1 Tax=unclassified Bradyrhizobium TaxID=2631580 RepID=UPI003D208139